jgi:hypothetical protein
MHFETRVTAANISSLLDHPLCEGVPVIQPFPFNTCPSRRDKFNAVRRLGYLEILFGSVFTKFIVCPNEGISEFWLRCGRFIRGKFKLIFREF